MTLIMKEAARSGDRLAVDCTDMGIRPMHKADDTYVGIATTNLARGQYAQFAQDETARLNLQRAWLKFAGKR